MSEILLPDAPWRSHTGLLRIIDALTQDGIAPRIVGGAVRDTILGLNVADIDIATPLLPSDVTERLEKCGVKVVPTGIAHGTVTAIADNKPYEITTLRRDVSTDGRRATVAFSSEWLDDAARRDFTINALYADPISGKIYDYFGGIEDLNNRYLRFIGDPAERIAEDHLRILRYFRFLARFGDNKVDTAALSACADAAKSLMALSRERISSELINLLSLANPLTAISLMVECKIFASFMPEIDPQAPMKLTRVLERERQFGLAPDPITRLLAILPDDSISADKVAMRLKLSNRMRDEIATRNRASDFGAIHIRDLAYRHSIETATASAILYAGDDQIVDALDQLKNWSVPVYPIKGGDLIKRGLTAGPVVARTLKAIERDWIASGFPLDDRLQTILDQAVNAALLEFKKS
jgi:poly(A) polymerase